MGKEKLVMGDELGGEESGRRVRKEGMYQQRRVEQVWVGKIEWRIYLGWGNEHP